MKSATVHDIEPARLHRLAAKHQVETAGIFADLSDGLLVAQAMLNLWGFEWDEAKFVLLIIGLCGDGEHTVEKYDEEMAKEARCTDRTIRRWRKDYLAKLRQLKRGPLTIDEGEYDADRRRYERTGYAVAPEVAAAIARAVAEARALPEYAADRHAALKRTAKENYYDLPDVPVDGRRRKPKGLLKAPLLRHVNNAKKALDRGQAALAEMNDLQRAAVLTREGENLRSTLEAMQAEIAQLLAAIPANDDSAEVDDMQDKMSGIPPAPEHSLETIAIFERVIDRARPKPLVHAVEVELRPPDPPPRELAVELDDDPRFYVEPRPPSVEDLEAQAIRAEACEGDHYGAI